MLHNEEEVVSNLDNLDVEELEKRLELAAAADWAVEWSITVPF